MSPLCAGLYIACGRSLAGSERGGIIALLACSLVSCRFLLERTLWGRGGASCGFSFVSSPWVSLGWSLPERKISHEYIFVGYRGSSTCLALRGYLLETRGERYGGYPCQRHSSVNTRRCWYATLKRCLLLSYPLNKLTRKTGPVFTRTSALAIFQKIRRDAQVPAACSRYDTYSSRNPTNSACCCFHRTVSQPL